MNDGAIHEACARAAHEVNRAYCLALGDTSQVPWDEAPEWQRTSCVNGVKGVLEGNGPEKSHELWLAEKEANGWKWGPIKDPERKEHPCFSHYSQLPLEQRQKDELFVVTVQRMFDSLEAALVARKSRETTLPADSDSERFLGIWREASVRRRLAARRFNRRKQQHKMELCALDMEGTNARHDYEEAQTRLETAAHAAAGLPEFSVKEIIG